MSNLTSACSSENSSGTIGIAHTRWATHGPPTDINAHPHLSMDGTLAVVHNGIVENFAALRSELVRKGYVIKSDTDTELIAHLIADVLDNPRDAANIEAVRAKVNALTARFPVYK